MFCKKCPSCDKNIEYSSYSSLNRSIRKNAFCKKCYNIKRALDAVRNVKVLEKNCPTCDKLIIYANKESLRLSCKENWECCSCSKSGDKNPAFGKKMPHSQETIDKIVKSNTGKKRSPEIVEMLRLAMINKQYIGENHPNWKGGITPINESIRKSVKYKNWRNCIYKRDNYTCKLCNATGKINVHHIKAFYTIIKSEVELYDINNGITLCECCHKKFHSDYGIKDFPSILEIYPQLIIIKTK